MNILAIIPARKGSKSIKDKNIRKINGKPLLTYSVEHALKSNLINRTIISTDSVKYGKIAQQYGAEFLFLRPNDFSKDYSGDLGVFTHSLNWLEENEGYKPDIVVHLRPTYPIRDVNDIDKMISILISNSNLDSIRSITSIKEIPFKMWFKYNENIIYPIINTGFEAHNKPRQNLPKVYIQNACIDVIRTDTIKEKHSMSGDNIYGYYMDHNWDIDYPEDLKKIRKVLK